MVLCLIKSTIKVELSRYPAHFVFLQSIFALAQLIFVVAIVTDVSMVLSAI